MLGDCNSWRATFAGRSFVGHYRTLADAAGRAKGRAQTGLQQRQAGWLQQPRNGGLDLSDPDPRSLDLQAPSDLAALSDSQRPSDLASSVDMSVPADLAMSSDMAGGIISGGPCFGSPMGATAFRVHWYGSGGRATVALRRPRPAR